MVEKLNSNRDAALRIVDFLEKKSTNYLSDFRVFCRVLELLGDPAAIPSLINLLKKYGETHPKHAKSQYRCKHILWGPIPKPNRIKRGKKL
ncbi:MAG: hypothetical protein Q6366_009205 [Candidatus Freyarchaeota archaeon]